MTEITPVDVNWLGEPSRIAVWRVRDNLIDCGPTTALPNLLQALGDWRPKRLILTHIHFDHGGAAGALAQRWPDLEVYVHRLGARHLAAPERLEASARRVFGELFDQLFGTLVPIDEQRLRPLDGGELVDGLQIAYTPGHASHHVSMFDDSGWAFVGDVAGVRIGPGGPVFAPLPPPDIDIDQWLSSVKLVADRRPTKLGITHFGEVADPEPHLAKMVDELHRQAALIESGIDADGYVARMHELLSADAADRIGDYEMTVSLPQNYVGLTRWLERRNAPAA